MKKPYEMTRVHCKFCGYNNHTKNKSWVKCKWCGKRLSVKNGEEENDSSKNG